MLDVSSAPWPDVYRRCRSIHSLGSNFRALVTSWQPAATFRKTCADYRAAGVDVPPDIENDLVAVQERLREERPSPHYEDVYHAATYILFIPLVTYTPRALASEDPSLHPYIHRGQRNNQWPVSPNTLRLNPGEAGPVLLDLVRARLRRTGAFVHR